MGFDPGSIVKNKRRKGEEKGTKIRKEKVTVEKKKNLNRSNGINQRKKGHRKMPENPKPLWGKQRPKETIEFKKSQ